MLCFIILQQLRCFFQKIFTTFAVAPIFREKSHILIAKGIDLFQSNFSGGNCNCFNSSSLRISGRVMPSEAAFADCRTGCSGSQT